MKIQDKAIIVFGRKDGEMKEFSVFDYPAQEKEAHDAFKILMKDKSIDEPVTMTIQRLSELISKGMEFEARYAELEDIYLDLPSCDAEKRLGRFLKFENIQNNKK